jgi:hypothetical protein
MRSLLADSRPRPTFSSRRKSPGDAARRTTGDNASADQVPVDTAHASSFQTETLPHVFTGTAELNAVIERVAPAILELLADGAPRTKPAIVEVLAGRHHKQNVVHALIRLAVTGRVEETGGRYTLGMAGEDGPPEAA